MTEKEYYNYFKFEDKVYEHLIKYLKCLCPGIKRIPKKKVRIIHMYEDVIEFELDNEDGLFTKYTNDDNSYLYLIMEPKYFNENELKRLQNETKLKLL